MGAFPVEEPWICSDKRRIRLPSKGLHTRNTVTSLQPRRSRRITENARQWRQVSSAYSWDWPGQPFLNLQGIIWYLTMSTVAPESENRAPGCPWPLLAFALQFNVVVCLRVAGRRKHTPSSSSYLIFCFCSLSCCLLLALQPTLCLSDAHMVRVSSWRDSSFKLCQS